ncbi:hypothetical protein H8D57_03735 [bacterium]|nr:hypothetical protein [bacterium]
MKLKSIQIGRFVVEIEGLLKGCINRTLCYFDVVGWISLASGSCWEGKKMWLILENVS